MVLIPMILHVTREQEGGEGDASVRGTGRGRGTLFSTLRMWADKQRSVAKNHPSANETKSGICW